MISEEELLRIQIATKDPKTGTPALTTLMYRVCENDHEKFIEASRLIDLFIQEAVKNERQRPPQH